MLGRLIDGHRVERALASGGMGALYLARHERLGQTVAIKVLHAQYARDPVIRERFEREGRAPVRLKKHKNIVKMFGAGELPDGQLYLIMEHLEGRALDEQLVKSRTFVPHNALAIAAQVGSGLHYAHSHGIIHRDIKPPNIFLTKQHDKPWDLVTVIDFGIAKSPGDMSSPYAGTRTGAAMGTPSYMPCEQFLDAGSVTPTADVFALAVVIWELVSGTLPWGHHAPAVVFNLQRDQRPAAPPEIPPRWIPILHSALSPNPDHRPPSTRALIIALANELEELPPSWGSGAAIVKEVAPDLLISSIDDMTVRAHSNAPPPAAPVVFPRTKVPDQLQRSPSGVPAPFVPVAAQSDTPSTVNARPDPATRTLTPTTIGGSSGVSQPNPITEVQKRGPFSLALLGIGAAALAGAAAFAVVHLRTRGNTSATQSATAHGDDAATPTPDAALAVVAAPTPPPAVLDAGVDAATTPTNATATITEKTDDVSHAATTGSKHTHERPVASKISTRKTKPSNTSTVDAAPATTDSTGSAARRKFDPEAAAGVR